ncbi:hypothetical protein ACUN9Y_17180 [Halomonas sp. V046]|uniref:hypothetical protein n=1 Tax=Halomonas sp. V046 TaxID=3459611 RepID=UPI0040442BE0
MPWRNNTELMEPLTVFFSTAAGVALGMVVRLLDHVQRGLREKFWSRDLLADGIGLIALAFIAEGIDEFFFLGRWAATAVAVALGRAGPTVIGRLIEALIERIRQGK